MKRPFYLFFLVLFILSSKIFAYNEPQKVGTTNPNSTYGITVIVHGFQLNGSFPSDFIDYAFRIKNRLNGSAAIYVNKSRGNIFYWQKISSGNGEKIFVYDWASDSNTLSAGPLESAADRLFSLLVDPYDENGNRIAGTAQLFDKPSHFIAHSRGCVLSLQVFLRLGKYFPNKKITQFTALDPHPASIMGDVRSPLSNVPENLAGVFGNANNCASPLCYNSNGILIRTPENVLYGDCYFRKKNFYESALGNFDGVNMIGVHNVELKDADLLTGGTSNIAHSLVHEWYFGTVYLPPSTQLPSIWYERFGGREYAGYYSSRIGGGGYLPNLGRMSIAEMESQIKSRQSGKPLQVIFNGDFEYPISSEWSVNNNGSTIRSNGKIKLPASQTNNFVILNRSQFYIPNEKKFLRFEITDLSINPQSLISIDWFVDKEKVATIGPQCLKDAGSFSCEIPKQLLGKVARFSIVFNNSSGVVGDFELDNFDLSDSPSGKIINNEGYCCNHTVTIEPSSSQFICEGESVTFTANATNPSSYKWFKNGKQVGSGATITADTTASYSVLAQKNGAECIASASVSVTMVKNTTMNFKLYAAIPNNNQCAYDSTSKTVTLCAGQSTTLTGTGCDGIVIWNTGVTANAITVNQAGNYAATCRIGQNCQKSDNVVVKIETATTPTVANAGADNAFCGKQTITLDGNTPENGCGTWSIVSPTGTDVGTFSDIHNPHATFTPKQFGTYRLQWTISLVCGNNSSSDFVDLNFVERKKVSKLVIDYPTCLGVGWYTIVKGYPEGGVIKNNNEIVFGGMTIIGLTDSIISYSFDDGVCPKSEKKATVKSTCWSANGCTDICKIIRVVK